MADAIDLTGDGGVLKKIITHAKADAITPTDDLPLVDGTDDFSHSPAFNKELHWCRSKYLNNQILKF